MGPLATRLPRITSKAIPVTGLGQAFSISNLEQKPVNYGPWAKSSNVPGPAGKGVGTQPRPPIYISTMAELAPPSRIQELGQRPYGQQSLNYLLSSLS